jgi:hypothetical protein
VEVAMRRDLAGRILAAGFKARNIQRFVLSELQSGVRIPLGRRLWGLRHGFTSHSVEWYGLTPDNVSDYVSDYARLVRTPLIDGPFVHVMNNKLAFSRLVASHGGPVPEYYCLIGDRGPVAIGEKYDMGDADGIAAACMTGGRFIIKPCTGGGGVRVSLISSSDGSLTLNGEPVTGAAFRSFIDGLDDALVCQYIEQAEYAASIFPDSANSIRILTMWDYEKGEPFIPFAGQRFGGPASVPVDNVAQGGAGVPVNVETGALGLAHTLHGPLGMSTFERHPHTGAQITGVVIPHWDDVRKGLLDVARRMSYIPYVGWDVIVTAGGFVIIEGNSHPHLGHQRFELLLDDPRVRAFYERFDIL